MKKERILTTAAFLLLIGASSQAGSAFASSRRGTDASTESSAASATRGMNGQQSRNETKVTGTVFDNLGEPIIGATVKVKGTKTATVTDLDGHFNLSAAPGSTLVVSYLGHQTQELTVPADGKLTVTLQSESRQIDEVVVTALGIKRSEKALSYNVQKVGADDLTTVKSTNFMNSLSGKVAGININASAAGMGGATRVVMRGPKSIAQSNQALYVIDGVPMTNTSQGTDGNSIYASQPGSEGIADINPEDIESISVLSGPAAAALYGSAAAQGVVMITTKKGKEGRVSVTVSHSSQFANPFRMPEFQNEYINKPGDNRSWGAKTASPYGAYDPKDLTTKIKPIYRWEPPMRAASSPITTTIGITSRSVTRPTC